MQPSFGPEKWRLSTFINELEYLGWPIERIDVPSLHGCRPIREYWLGDKTIRAAKLLRW